MQANQCVVSVGMIEAHVKSHGFFTTNLKPQSVATNAKHVILINEHKSEVATIVLTLKDCAEKETRYMQSTATIDCIKMSSKLANA